MSQMDKDKDGAVSFAELDAFTKARRGNDYSKQQVQRRFNMMDTNKDGSISEEEMNNASRGKIQN
jgi:Ca2+-binding EF-hand superfamily protein